MVSAIVLSVVNVTSFEVGDLRETPQRLDTKDKPREGGREGVYFVY